MEALYDKLLKSPVLDYDPWSRANLHTFRKRHEVLLEALTHLDGPRSGIADIGCHNGFFLRLAAELGFERLIGVDFFLLSQERSFLSDLDNAELLKVNFNSEDFLKSLPNSSLDAVVSTEVLEHIYHYPAGYLSECWRVIRPGGLLLLSTPNPSTIAKAIKVAFGRSPTWGDLAFARTPKVDTMTNEPLAVWDIHFREYTFSDMLSLIADLPRATVLDSGFVANQGAPGEAWSRRAVKSLVWKTGAGRTRALGATQYHVVRRATS